ncbi:hypothetical protein [Conyzicola sp.]|uniref:hypothetical protein n=1 Tax=Conyzicola sp. TaxID=1969404 RepID=UPI00398919A9
MRFVLAIVSFVAAALLIGLGIAQKTILAAPDEITVSTSVATDAPVTVVSGEALNAYPRSQFVQISGSDENFVAYGRTSDVIAWIGDASYNTVSYDATAAELESDLTEGTEDEVPNPADSDLWLASYTDQASMTINVPEDFSLLVVSDGVKPAPSEVSITWPVDNSTPWANTFVVAGGILLVIGLVLLFWAVAHIRKSRGPRRKSPQKMPKLPRQPRYKPIKAKKKELDANAKGRRAINSRVAIVPVVLVTALALGGCSADFWAGREPVAAPTASADPVADAEAAAQLDPPAVTEQQAKRIVADLVAVAAEADTGMNDDLIKTRLAGPALDLRLTNYAARRADGAIPAVEGIPEGKITLTLPQVTENSWPRAVLAVIEDTATAEDGKQVPPVAVMLIQDDPRSNYKAQYVIRLEPGAVIEGVAPASVGAGRLQLDSKFLVVEPQVVGADYGDILMVDSDSTSYDLFEAEGDSLRTDVGEGFKEGRKAAFPATSTLTFERAESKGPVVALSTNDSSALVTVDVNEDEIVKVVEAGAVANAPAAVKALTGKTTSAKGFRATYGYQLLFLVPSVETGGKIVLLGYTQGLVAASELP